MKISGKIKIICFASFVFSPKKKGKKLLSSNAEN
jgi:hypothetical protein